MRVQLMLDSGVFSSWNKGEPDLDLKAYIRFIKSNNKLLFSYVNLDSIPGVFGHKRTMRDVEISARKSYDNLQIMKSHGLKPIPVFHQDEDFKWFERYLKDGETYIGVSSGKDGQGDTKRKWIQRVFDMVCGAGGKPLIHIHGFGITRGALLLEFPWYTADSTTWSITAAFGKILIPRYNALQREYDYSFPPVGIAVSGVPNKANNATQFEGEVFFAGVGLKEAHIRDFIEKEVGTTIQAVRYTLIARQRAILVYYTNLMKNLPDIKHRKVSSGFFEEPTKRLVKKAAPHVPLRIMFATLLNYRACHELMNEVGASTRLLSYYELRNAPPEKLKEFIETGTISIRRNGRSPRSLTTEAGMNFQRMALVQRLSEQAEEIEL